MTTLDAPARKAIGLIPLFVATIFLSAALLFFVQPLFARIVLPQIGGAPGVWTTAMLFFQSVLLGGYLYAHLSTRYFPRKAQLALHLAIWALALAFLPLGVPEGWVLDLSAPVAGQTLLLFAAGVGVHAFPALHKLQQLPLLRTALQKLSSLCVVGEVRKLGKQVQVPLVVASKQEK